MGSDSDWTVMEAASVALTEFGIAHDVEIVSAHRTPERMIEFGRTAVERGLKVIIAGAGGAAHLPGMLAAVTTLPVIGVPVALAKLDGLATVSIGGARNAGLLAARILSTSDSELAEKLATFALGLEQLVADKNAALASKL
jgi:5-(carboxyamino)imidazole ribonucleotide mutase